MKTKQAIILFFSVVFFSLIATTVTMLIKGEVYSFSDFYEAAIHNFPLGLLVVLFAQLTKDKKALKPS